ncbi:MAG TPA: gluconokinase [Longimicrobiaceae bacterium]|nr:gluconokinase [Longimicrobiaceae bacterium]
MLALDVGSSSVRARLYDAAGRPVGGAPVPRVRYGWTATPDGGMEVGADRLLELTAGVLDAAAAAVRESGVEVAAVAQTTFWHSLLGVGADGAPLTPVYGWGDVRASAAALRLREMLDPDAAHQRTGCFFHPSYPVCKLLWLRGAAGDTFPRAASWMSFGEYLELRLFGARRCSLSMASGTGLLDLHAGAWDAEVLAAVGVAEAKLSPLVDADAPAPALRPEWARRWPELAGVPWLPPLGDGACASLGSGAVGVGRVGITVGTSAAVRALWAGDPVRIPPGLWCYRLDRRRLVMGRALSNGGNGVAWLRETLRLPPPGETEAVLAALEPDAHGLTVLPALLGERAPGWEDWRGASVLGLTRATTPAEVLRAWLEATAYHVAGALEALEGALGPAAEVVASGGAMHASPAWRRILADVLGRRVVLAAEREASSRGAALVALERLGLLLEPAASQPPAAVHEPDPASRARYRAARARQDQAEALLARLAPGAPKGGGEP